MAKNTDETTYGFDDVPEEEFTLESILAEYGDSGDKREKDDRAGTYTEDTVVFKTDSLLDAQNDRYTDPDDAVREFDEYYAAVQEYYKNIIAGREGKNVPSVGTEHRVDATETAKNRPETLDKRRVENGAGGRDDFLTTEVALEAEKAELERAKEIEKQEELARIAEEAEKAGRERERLVKKAAAEEARKQAKQRRAFEKSEKRRQREERKERASFAAAEERARQKELDDLKKAGLTEEDISFFDNFTTEKTPAEKGLTENEPAGNEQAETQAFKQQSIGKDEPTADENVPEAEIYKDAQEKAQAEMPELKEKIHKSAIKENEISSEPVMISLNIADKTEEHAIYSRRRDKNNAENDNENVNAFKKLEYDDDWDEEDEEHKGFFKRLRERRKAREAEAEYDEDDYADYLDSEEDEYEEPADYTEEYRKYASSVNKLSTRCFLSFILCVAAVVLTVLFERGTMLPFGLGDNLQAVSGVILILQLLVMILGAGIAISGIEDIFTGTFTGDTMVTLSCVMTVVSGFIVLITGDSSHGLPLGAVSACSMYFAMRGKRAHRAAMADTIRTVTSSANHGGIVLDSRTVEDRAVLKRVPDFTYGFFKNLTERDVSETVLAKAGPLLTIAAVVFAVMSSIGRGRAQDFTYNLSALLCVCGSFSVYTAFAKPFKIVTGKLRKIGGAIAGWGGACDINNSDCTLITDDSLFPKGTVSINGIKVMENVSQKTAIVYTSSMIKESACGLSDVFDEFMKTRGYHYDFVKNFACCEGGGISGRIDGHDVLVGSAGLMNLKGIRIPEEINAKDAMFTSIDGNLAAMFVINYIPANSVQKALLAMLRTKMGMLFAVRDFNISPRMLRQKFKMNMDGIEYIPVQDCYNLSGETTPEGALSAGIICREGLGPMADVITGGRQLKVIASLSTAVMTVGMVLGLLVVFFICWIGEYASLSAVKILLFMICWHIIVNVLSVFAGRGH